MPDRMRIPIIGEDVKSSPWFRASTVRTVSVKVACTRQKKHMLRMSLALDGESLINVLTILEEGEEPFPECPSFPRMQKGLGIADQNEAISGAREEDVETLRRVHESNHVGFI